MNMGVQGWLKAYFGFSQKEISGIRFLTLGIAALMLGPPAAKWWMGEGVPIDSLSQREIERFFAAMVQQESDADGEKEIEYFTFDPNQLDQSGWMRLGFTERQTSVILNYTAKGGRFRRKEDLRKIFSVSEADYLRVADYIVIANQQREETPWNRLSRDGSKSSRVHTEEDGRPIKNSFPRTDPYRSGALTIEINRADSFEFQQLPGIGPAFSSRIVRYRERLGGFHHPAQLLQVYGMDSARFEGFVGYLEVDTSLIRRIPINRADYQELRQHPSIGHKLAGLIVRYREHHGPFRTIDDLKRIQVLDEDFLRSIAPYLGFE